MNSTQPSGIAGTSLAPEDEWTTGNKIPHPQQKRFDPLKVLPEEIWIPIIAESVSEMYFRTRTVISQDTLLDFMQVSRSWNVQISSSAVLWVDIILKDEYDAAVKATLALYYSRQAPLALYMHYPTGWWDTLQEQIVANRMRIAKLVVYGDYTSFDLPILRQLSPLPSLTTLDYDWEYKAQQDTLNYLSDSPLAWTNILLDRDTLGKITIRGLQGIHLDCELEDVFDLLEGSKHLREVLMSRPGAKKPTSSVKSSSLQGPPLPWTSLKYLSRRDSFLEGIFARLSNLVDLRIRLSQQIFRYLMPQISQLENLSILDMSLVGKWDQFERLVIPRASTSVREVTVELLPDMSPATSSVADALSRCFPNIRFLELDVNDLPTIHLLTSSTTFQSLQSLRLNSFISQEDAGFNSDSILEPFAISVERVSYMFYGELLKELIPLQSCHIKYLEISCSTSSQMDLYGQGWTAIRTINLDSNTTVNWKGPAYQHLHTISFKTVFSHIANRAGNETKLCRDIALHPEYFPALSELEFDSCPELDILFILLETRNAATRPGISPIATLVIPTRCPPFLVERLRDLVKGINHGGSNYYDLSIAGNYDIITDGSITGCASCHRALRFCDYSLHSTHVPFTTLVMEYPESVTEILESWDMRAEKWYPVERRIRYYRCNRGFPLVSITR